ncbi:MAG: hypothetical protein ACJ78Q_00440 [Chloroflexia bacterium]
MARTNQAAPSARASGPATTAAQANSATNRPNRTAQVCSVSDAKGYLAPEAGSPPSGGTIRVGDRITLDLMLRSGAYNVADAQSYLHFDATRLQNVDANAGGCVVTNTVTADTTGAFDTALENEVCNGPSPCVFRMLTYGPGDVSFASGAKSRPPYNGPDFRVALIGLCATAAGDAVIHWDFAPPAPSTRDSQIVDDNANVASNDNCYVDYLIHIVSTNPTPTPTGTPLPSSSSLMVGHVTWQSRAAQPNPMQQMPVTLTLTGGATQVDYQSQLTDAGGYFTVPVGGLPSGTYNWRAKDPQYLSVAGSVTLSGGPQTAAEMGLMRAGDASNDNTVNLNDFIILKTTFNSTTDLRADFNGNRLVDVGDFAALRINFGQGGGVPPGP